METRVAVIEVDVKNLGKRFTDFLDDMRSLRGTWTMVTITIVGFLFVIIGVFGSGFYWMSDRQMSMIESQAEMRQDMKEIKEHLVKINASIEEISKEHTAFKR